MKYGDNQLRQGAILQPTLPLERFRQKGVQFGNINFPLEIDGRIHRQGHTYFEVLATSALAANTVEGDTPDWNGQLSFAQATLQAAQITPPTDQGDGIQFLGPVRTFEHVPFWYVLDSDPWENYLQSGAFFSGQNRPHWLHCHGASRLS